ncbi:MAG: hypothetical protein QM676_03385 [Novosphingobium sp.]
MFFAIFTRLSLFRTIGVAVFVLLAVPYPAQACIDLAPFKIEDIRQADAVFTGKVTRYEIVSPEQPGTLSDYALITVVVQEMIKGQASGEIQLYWHNSTFDLPDPLYVAEPSIFAVVRADRLGLPLRGPSATTFASRRPDILQILQAPCSGEFILPYSRQGVANIRAILAGTALDPDSVIAPQEGTVLRQIPAERHWRSPLGVWHWIGVAIAIGVIGLVLAWLLRRGRRRTVLVRVHGLSNPTD